jgi:molybdate/tungstate transport system permease protein
MNQTDQTSVRGALAQARGLSGLAFHAWMVVSCALVVAFIFGPLARMISAPTWERMLETVADPQVLASVRLSLTTAATASVVALVLGTPLAYALARHDFPGKRVVESLIDLPIMIPHPVVGIALLSLAGRDHWFGALLQRAGVEIMGTATGITCVLLFVGLPFFVNTAKAGFEAVPPRLERVSRSLGAGPGATFLRVTLPLTWRHMLVGFIMCMARGISEFGAVVIVAYHPMIAPVLMYERFTAYGLAWSQPVAVLLILVSMAFFLALRLLSGRGAAAR